ncbi:hypothetical protein, conserved [Eimeria maxima]|uniref:Rhoptry neck protein RON3 n=1 Tax=Eimeria maxima TaxID=5804 RepID=U6M0C8_EIMMA|nr:hypothetical protein, conserved [Eimeria maxima]CDJ57471.1 hypothetical protein, conserved [Eimeria maxima]
MRSFNEGLPALGRWRTRAQLCVFVFSLLVCTSGLAKPVEKNIVLHDFSQQDSARVPHGPAVKGYSIVDIEEDMPSFVQGGEKDMWVGLLDQEFMMQTSHALVQAFKKASKYIYSRGFVRLLYASNPWLKHSIATMEQKLEMVKKLEKVAEGSKLFYWRGKPASANKLLAEASLARVFPKRSRLLGSGRQFYQKHLGTLTQALQQAKAGTKALELIMASKTLPLYSWTQSMFNHPLATLQNTVVHGFEEAIGGVTGLFTSEVRGSCFSFAYRVNSIAPYTAVYPGGILGSIMKGLVRSYFLVFQQSLINFKGIFAMLIGIICKTRVIQAAVGMRGDPVGQGLMDRLFKREAVVLTTILFQMHAVDVESQYREAEEIKSALSGPGGSWALAEGLFVGGAEFGRAFVNLVRKYRKSAAAYVQACEALKSGSFESANDQQDNPENTSQDRFASAGAHVEKLIGDALEFFDMAHPEASGGDDPLTTEQKVNMLRRSCRKNRRFVETYEKDHLEYTKRVIVQMVRVLQYYFKYFKSYIADILSIFYESAIAMLEAKINDSLGAAEGSNSPADEMVASEARHAARKSAAQSATDESTLPRKLFRAPKFAEEATNLANGLYEAAGALSLFEIANEDSASAAGLRQFSLRLLTSADSNMRKGLGEIYKRFLNSQVLLSRVEKNQERIRVFELIAKCQTPLEEKTEEEKQVCGTTVTSEIDPNEFIAKSMAAMNLPISSPEDDIAFHSAGDVTRVFESWLKYATEKRQMRTAQIAQLAAETGSNIVFLTLMRNAVNDKLTFRRFDYVEGTAKLMLYDESGRSLIFTGLVAPSQDGSGKRAFKPDPLDCTSTFRVEEGNKGVLSFYVLADSRRGGAEAPQEHPNFSERQLTPAITVRGTIEYDDTRKELLSIQNDPNAIRDAFVAHFMEKRGRVAAETLAGVLMLLHRKLPIFWKRSPVDFVQHLTPKMFFDVLYVLSTQAYDQAEATVTLDGKLYTFPKSFGAMKDIVLSSLNRAIVRMHSLNASDAALLIAMGTVHFAYKKIQKHRTGRTSVMHLFLKEVNHIMNILKSAPEQLKALYPECEFISNWDTPQEEGVLKCAVFRFMKIGSLTDLGDKQEEIETYVTAFVNKLTELKGQATWSSYLNLDYFLKDAKMYGKTAAKYKFEVLYNQVNDIRGTDEEESELAKLMKKLHPSLAGHRPPRPQKKKGFVAMFKRLQANFKVLPQIIRQKVTLAWRQCYARMRRFFGSRRSILSGWRISPKVIQGPHFMGALKFAEVTTYPDLSNAREVLIEVADLEEFGKVLLTLETVAATLDNPAGMYNTVTQVRSTAAFTPSAREEHAKLIERAKVLGKDVVKVAAGWILKTAGGSGISMALGLLALHDTAGTFSDKALQLRYLTSEALAYLSSSLDLAYILKNLPPQTRKDAEMMRFNMNASGPNAFVVKAQCEPRGLGLNTADPVKVEEALLRVEEALDKEQGLPEGSSNSEKCSALIGSVLRGPITPTTSLPHEALLESDAFGLCFLLLRLRGYMETETETVTIDELLQTIYIDGLPVGKHLDFLQQRRADMEERKLRAKLITPFLRLLLLATVESLGTSLGGISFKSYDAEAKMIAFQFTFQAVSPPKAPAEVLAYAADLLLGSHSETKQRFISFAFDGPQFLLDWYRYVETGKMQAYVDASREQNLPVTFQDMAKLSRVYTVTDLADLAYTLRQSSKLDPARVAREAAIRIMEDETKPPLKRYGLAHMLVDMVAQAAHLKQKCLGKALEEYENFSSSTLLDRELFRYDCYYNFMYESSSFADVARSISEEDIAEVMAAIDSAYEAETKSLYEQLLNSNVHHTAVANAAFTTGQQFPITGMMDVLTSEFLTWVREKRSWDNVVIRIREMREIKWVATRKTTTLGRPVTSVEHPLLMNPYQILIDIMLAAMTGSAKRRRFPIIAPLKRLKAFFSMVKPGRKSRAEYKADIRGRQRLQEQQNLQYNLLYNKELQAQLEKLQQEEEQQQEQQLAQQQEQEREQQQEQQEQEEQQVQDQAELEETLPSAELQPLQVPQQQQAAVITEQPVVDE